MTIQWKRYGTDTWYDLDEDRHSMNGNFYFRVKPTFEPQWYMTPQGDYAERVDEESHLKNYEGWIRVEVFKVDKE